jgi:uncharacterized phage protein (TIGR01671 family)
MELKVRVWDNEKKQFFKTTYEAYKGKLEEILFGQSGDICLRRINEHGIVVFEHESIYPNRFVKSVFTGLKDKNGKEIYEGDILNYGHKNNNVEVKFENGCFSVFGEPLGWDFDSEEKPILIDSYSNHAIIVGNIYENPELLKN